MTLILYGFHKAQDGPSPSGYCQKLETYFRATGFTEYRHQVTLAMRAPKKKLPYITVDNHTVADSTFIIQFLIKSGRIGDLDDALEPGERADSRAWQTYVEELIYPGIVWTRWAEDGGYEEMRKEIAPLLPFGLKTFALWFLRRNIVNAMWTQGVGRHSKEDIHLILKEYLLNLAARLEDGHGKYFHGDTPTTIDVINYGFLANSLGCPANPYFTSLILESSTLRAYVLDLTKIWFPEYETILELVS